MIIGIIDEYIKTKIENVNYDIQKEEKINRSINEILNELYCRDFNIEVDLIKMIKSYSNITINSSKDLMQIINYILNYSLIKQIIIIYKKDILDFLNINEEIEKIDLTNVIKIEVCDKNSKFNEFDNLMFFSREVNQITYKEFMRLSFNKLGVNDLKCEKEYKNLIEKILLYAIDKKEVDFMINDIEKIRKINEMLYEEFNLNDNNPLV